MNTTKIILIVCILFLCGCVLFEGYTTRETVIDPITGQPTEVITEHEAPAVQVFKSAVAPLTSGNWWGAIIAAVTTGVTSVLAAMKSKEAKKNRVSAAEAAALAKKNRVSAAEAAALAETLRGIAENGGQKKYVQIALKDAATSQQAAHVRDHLREIRKEITPEA